MNLFVCMHAFLIETVTPISHSHSLSLYVYTIYTSNKQQIKVFLYLWAVAAGGCDTTNNDINNVESQRKGTVVIVFPSSQHVYPQHEFVYNKSEVPEASQFKFSRDRASVNALVASVIPMRFAALHICLPDKPLFKVVTSIFGIVLSAWNSRTKIHLGNPLELKYCLQGYGIPIELIPMTETGNVKSVNLKQWIKLRTYVERQTQERMAAIAFASSSSSENSDCESIVSTLTTAPMNNIVECPGSNDVIFRRGKSMTYHPGNVMFQNLIESQIQEHTIDPNTIQSRRVAIEMELIQIVRTAGGRFLKWEIDRSLWTNMNQDMPNNNNKNSISSSNNNNNNSTNYDSSTSGYSSSGRISSSHEATADKEIQQKVHYAFRDFRKKMLKTPQNLQVNTSSTYAFERQDGQKRKRFNNGARSNINKNKNNSGGGGGGGLVGGTGCGFFFSTDDGSYNNVSNR